MKTHYTQGINYMGKIYVWNKNELFRLPFESHNKFYGLLKCKPWNKTGFYLGVSRKSINQLIAMTVEISEFTVDFEHPDVPF